MTSVLASALRYLTAPVRHQIDRRVVYLLRDGRDAMVSSFHFLAALGQVTSNEADFLTLVTTGEGLVCRWDEHVTQWLANPFGADMLVMKYEDLIAQPTAELRRF